MRAGHTYRSARRNAMRAAGLLPKWGAYPLRVWMSGKRKTLKGFWPWQVLVRTMPPLHKAA